MTADSGPARLITCQVCGGKYFDDHEGRAAHRRVFLHQPQVETTSDDSGESQ